MFRDATLPLEIAYGASGGPEFATAIYTSPGGWEDRQQHWPQVRGRWDISYVNRTTAQMAPLLAFFRSVALGRAYSFRFRDWRDSTFDNQVGVGDGSTVDFQLSKVYQSGILTYTRPLDLPVCGTIRVWVNGVETLAFMVYVPGGKLAMASAPPSGAVVWASGTFDVMVRFGADALPLTAVAPGIVTCAGLELLEVVQETYVPRPCDAPTYVVDEAWQHRQVYSTPVFVFREDWET